MRVALLSVVAAAVLSGCAPSSQGQPNLPAADAAAGCPAAPVASFASAAPDYGFGSGPVYLSGQLSWYSGGQEATIMVDPKYAGPLTVRAAQLGGSGTAQITLADEPSTNLANISAKESQHSVTVVPAVRTPDGGLQLPADPGSHSWRAWFGRLSTSGPGCFALHADGASFSEVIVFNVHAGPAPPG